MIGVGLSDFSGLVVSYIHTKESNFRSYKDMDRVGLISISVLTIDSWLTLRLMLN